jgi:plastocyanin
MLVMRHLGIIAFAVVALLTWSACGSDEGDGSAGGGETIEVKATDFAFDPSTITVDQAGSVTFRLVNDGKMQHALEIEGHGVEEETDTIGPGETAEMTVDLSEEGEYEMYCPVDGHRGLGMEGSIQVGGGAGGSETDTGETTTGSDTGY